MPIVRELITAMGLKTDEKSMQRAETSITTLKNGLELAAKAVQPVVNGLKAITSEVAVLGDRFDKMSKRIGVNVQSLQELDFVAGLSGTSISEFEIAVRRLQLSADKAAQGAKEFSKGFKRLGVSLRDSSGRMRSAEELLPLLADGFAKLRTSTERTALAQQLLGRSGTSLIPVLIQGTDAINEQRKEARELGAVMDDELIAISTEFIDTQLRVQKGMLGIKNIIARQLLPFLTKSQKRFVDWVKTNQQFLRQNLGEALRRIVTVLDRLQTFAGRVVSVFDKWLSRLSPLQKGLLSIAGIAAGIAALLLLPGGSLLLIAALVALIIDDFEAWRKGAGSVIGLIIGDFKDLEETIDRFRETTIGQLIEKFLEFGRIAQDIFFSLIQFIIDLFTEGPERAIRNLLRNLEASGGDLLKWAASTAEQTAKVFWDVFEKHSPSIIELLGARRRVQLDPTVLGRIRAVAAGGAQASFTGQPQVVPTPRGGQIILQPRTTINQEINAGPGMSAEEVGGEATRQMSEELDRRNRQAMRALTVGAQ